MELNKLIFPAPQPSYDHNLSYILDEPGSLIFIPKYKQKSPQNTTSFFSNKSTINSQEESKSDLSPGDKKSKKLNGHIPCLYLPCEEENRYSNTLLIYFHGNAEDIYLAYDLLRNIRKELKVNILAIEYPGYGIYPGETKAEKICEDSEVLFDYLVKELEFPAERIVIFGRSIGTGPATYLASKRNPGALVLMSAYLSIKAVVIHLVGRILAWAVAERFRNIDNIQKVKCPVFFLHGKMDDLIPCDHSKELYNRSNIGEYWFPNKMTHNSFNILNDLLIPIDTFLDKYKFKVRMEEKATLLFPDSVYQYPNEENNNKHTNSSVMTSLYNKLFDKK